MVERLPLALSPKESPAARVSLLCPNDTLKT